MAPRSPIPSSSLSTTLVRHTCWLYWIPLIAELDYRADHCLTLLAYDRFNCGDSDPLPSYRSINDTATCASDLCLLLKAVENRHGPAVGHAHTRLVLVGSSIGCCIIRLLLQNHSVSIPDVQSVILLDSYLSNSDFVSLFPERRDDEPEELTRTRDIIARTFHPSVRNSERFDRSTAAALLPSSSEPKFEKNPELAIVVHDFEYTAHEMAGKMGLDEACYLKYVDSALMKYHEGLEKLSPNSRRMVAEESGHFIHLDRPDIVIKEIMRCIDSQ
ncbi:hypothetical protein EX30DRAFT_367298 [Ascodesmis nigricans]|uniref:AB hydrolase-1 domain-containing protein n=1 Tax=Ascodesmis nigricans TaxID=341454 RepID=A0A4S2MQF1_9PEZI|nr:hypothetical protein EX30DRAFT_367298 [Ascodesmis nigricans]